MNPSATGSERPKEGRHLRQHTAPLQKPTGGSTIPYTIRSEGGKRVSRRADTNTHTTTRWERGFKLNVKLRLMGSILALNKFKYFSR